MRVFKNRQGMTLTEVMAVVTIIGVMAALAYPKYEIILEKFRAQEQVPILLALYAAQIEYKKENGNGKFAKWPAQVINQDTFDVITIPASNYFAIPVLGCGGIAANCNGPTTVSGCSGPNKGYIARVTRKLPLPSYIPQYHLYALDDGSIACRPVSAILCPQADICRKLGFDVL